MISDTDQTTLLSRIRDIPDWPEPGVTFKDITPLLADARTFARTVELLSIVPGDQPVDAVVGIEARGFILGAPVAQRLGAGFVPVRKEGKLPWQTSAASYELEYGQATIEIHQDAVSADQRVLIVDDVLATGGTARATVELLRGCGAQVVGMNVLIELGFLHGRDRLSDVDLTALIQV